MTGSVPGIPMQIGQTRVFGSSGWPSAGAVAQAQNILDAVRSCACTSIPMIVSYRVLATIFGLYRWRTLGLALRPSGILPRHEDRRMGGNRSLASARRAPAWRAGRRRIRGARHDVRKRAPADPGGRRRRTLRVQLEPE